MQSSDQLEVARNSFVRIRHARLWCSIEFKDYSVEVLDYDIFYVADLDPDQNYYNQIITHVEACDYHDEDTFKCLTKNSN